MAPYLTHGEAFRALHISTVTYESKDFICIRKSLKSSSKTYKNKHFLALIDADHQIILGLELYVYLICSEEKTIHQIFVSKADTTGLSKYKVKVADIVQTMIRHVDNIQIEEYTKDVESKKSATDINQSEDTLPVVSAIKDLAKQLQSNPSFYRDMALKKVHESKPLEVSDNIIHRISLFTRSSDQYLFPDSSENKNKHIINGNQLLRWWISILDSVAHSLQEWQCCITIPGSDDESIRKFTSNTKNSWKVGSIFEADSTTSAIYAIPLLPDDPKGRFLEHLVVEGRHKTVSAKAFWDELGYRQEFRIGNVVGIIGCELSEIHGKNRLANCIKRSRYRQVIRAIKRTDFSDSGDVRQLVSTEIPDLVGDVYEEITGTKAVEKKETSKRTSPVVNNISGLVKRKKQ